ncbi:hypothetical protein LUQ84_003145 [Hamiltosporidium tvaerminnensis]|nr:hypothetical protein LUQ84_003145 [Hamiltosporidium tvaerminnensis]
MDKINDDNIYCKFYKKEVIHKKVTSITRSIIFNIFDIFPIFLLHLLLLNESACLQIEISFLNEVENSTVNCNKTFDNLDIFCEARPSDKRASKIQPKLNFQDVSEDTPALTTLLHETDLIIASVTNPNDSEISSKKRRHDLILLKSNIITDALCDSPNHCQNNEESISGSEEMKPIEQYSNKKRKISDLIEFENSEWIVKTNTSITFDYSNKFLIQSKYFDKYIASELNHVKYNVTEFTKTNVDITTFEIFLFIIRFGYHKKCLEIKFDGFITLLELFYDLLCYAESNVICKVYNHLIPCLIIYKNDISSNIDTVTLENKFLIQKSLFLPFLHTFFEYVDVRFDKNTNILSFSKRESQINFYLFDKKNIDEIYIRTTPEVINILKTESDDELRLFYWLISLFKIIGIKISNDNIYNSEFKEKVKACKYENVALKVIDSDFDLCNSHVFESIISQKNNEIKFLELERVNISEDFLNFIKILCKIESLILYTCKLPAYSKFLCHLNFCFPKLKTLKVNTLVLTAAFFKSLRNLKIEYLDL